ncbi:MAG: 16S rRNA (guanine(527)-N(7))-methyltransferase RsmG, partial [Candidatus Poribacteria bacterium]|nr:16S rRNA (guanine(527)-N(7))-methyltransferase RsmG [Candidatus Poribacteria bacterium]
IDKPVKANQFRDLLKQTLLRHGFPLAPVQLDQFVSYWQGLKRWNSRINLTAIRDDSEVIVKHFLDSLSVLQYFSIKSGDSVVDIGTGAGFPGIPIKIYIPNIQLVLVESAVKKVSFLRFLISQFGREAPSDASAAWSNVRIVAQRAEECARQTQHIRAYDWVLTRYVASLEDSMAYCLPLLKRDGTWIAYKSCNVQLWSEIEAAMPQLQSLGARVESRINSQIAELNRTYVAIRIKELD